MTHIEEVMESIQIRVVSETKEGKRRLTPTNLKALPEVLESVSVSEGKVVSVRRAQP